MTQTKNQTNKIECQKSKIMKKVTSKKTCKKILEKHTNGWCHKFHYMKVGGQCGQSCPCCRADVFNKKIDPDAWFGACPICLKKE